MPAPPLALFLVSQSRIVRQTPDTLLLTDLTEDSVFHSLSNRRVLPESFAMKTTRKSVPLVEFKADRWTVSLLRRSSTSKSSIQGRRLQRPERKSRAGFPNCKSPLNRFTIEVGALAGFMVRVTRVYPISVVARP